MTHRPLRKSKFPWLASLIVAGTIYSCGSSSDDAPGVGAGNGKPTGASCAADDEGTSGVCTDGACTGNGSGAPAGSACDSDGECASGSCDNGTCAPGEDLPDGKSCSADGECASGECVDGVCGSSTSGGGGNGSTGTGNGGTTGTGAPGTDCSANSECQSGLCIDGFCSAPTGTGVTPGAHFPGSGTGYRPLTTGCGPDTAALCTGECEQMGGDPGVTVIRPPATLCFEGPEDPTPETPSAVIEQVIEEKDGVAYVHIRITFDPTFTDNTYGEGACCGWGQNRGHTFVSDLTKSDHTELRLTNGDTETVMEFKVDLVSPEAEGTCKGFDSLGVNGGDGSMITGDPAHILAVATSSSRNINGCGYCDNAACAPSGDCTVDSPATDDMFTANPETPNWDYRIVYEAWIALDAFGDSGFGQAYITYTHSSPGKGVDTINVGGTPCPPEWDTPYCPPDVSTEGGNCFGNPPGGGGGATGAGGETGVGGGPGGGGDCPVNWELYISSEGQAICTPIPFAGYPDMAPCPAGYHLDLATEGRYCLPD